MTDLHVSQHLQHYNSSSYCSTVVSYPGTGVPVAGTWHDSIGDTKL